MENSTLTSARFFNEISAKSCEVLFIHYLKDYVIEAWGLIPYLHFWLILVRFCLISYVPGNYLSLYSLCPKCPYRITFMGFNCINVVHGYDKFKFTIALYLISKTNLEYLFGPGPMDKYYHDYA